jgi:flagellar biosynthesis/type III secretory pathway ATPase
VASPEQISRIQNLREALSTYHNAEDLIQLGAYVAGTNPKLDAAIRQRPALLEFLKQGSHDFSPQRDTLARLAAAVSGL